MVILMSFYPVLCGVTAAAYCGPSLSIVQVAPGANQITQSLGLLINRGIIYILVERVAHLALITLEYLIRAKIESQAAQAVLYLASVAVLYNSEWLEGAIKKELLKPSKNFRFQYVNQYVKRELQNY